MRTITFGTLAMLIIAGTARADIEYSFAVNGAGSVKPFSFSFTTPTFVTAGESPAFTPFTVSNNSNFQWTPVLDMAGFNSASNYNCFEFVTDAPGTTTVNSNCGGGFLPGPVGFLIVLTASGPLPAATGLYNYSTFIAPGMNGAVTIVRGTATLDVTDVPEPASVALVGTLLAAFAWRARRRTQAIVFRTNAGAPASRATGQ